jgi:hypothetical protein
MQFFPERNDGYLNKYNRLTTMAWQTNTDVSPCTSVATVIEYIVKYAVKPETKSASYREMATKVILFVNETRPYQSMVTKLMNKLIEERGYSAQEVMHLLLNLELSQGSRAFISVDFLHPDQHSRLYRVDAGETCRGLSLLEHYMQRPVDLDDVSYHTFLRSHAHRAPYNLRTRSLDRILNYFPRYPTDEVDDYGRAKLMLHHPFWQLDDLLFIEAIHDKRCDTYYQAFEFCREHCNHPRDSFDDDMPKPEPSIYEDTQEDPDVEALNNMDAEWGEFARVLPDSNSGNVNTWDMLVRRPENQVDWSERVGHIVTCKTIGGRYRRLIVRSPHATSALPLPIISLRLSKSSCGILSSTITTTVVNKQVKQVSAFDLTCLVGQEARAYLTCLR